MKKILVTIFLLSIALIMSSCSEEPSRKVSVITPTGTPSLGIASAISDEKLVDVNIVSGSDPLKAAFTKGNYDIIVAPVNLGSIFYNKQSNEKYLLYQTIVWGNYYLASNEEIKSFDELENKTVTVFGKNSTPDVVLRTLIKSKNLNVNLEYVDDVATANSYLMSGKSSIIVSAEPSLTKLKSKKAIYTFDLQQEWLTLTGNYSLPQAGIFVKASMKNDQDVLNVLNNMKESVKMASSKPNKLVLEAVEVDSNLKAIGADTLQAAIPYCNLKIVENHVPAVEYYFTKVLELGLGSTLGGKLPDEGFYF